MTFKTLMAAAATLSLLAGPALAQTAPASAPAATVVAKGDVLQTLQAAGQFTTLLRALDMAGLSGLLKRPQPITLFAPTDAAFAADPSLSAILQPGNPQLQSRLVYHIFNGALAYADVQGKAGAVPGAGGSIYVDGASTPNKVNDATLVQPPVAVTNGVVYVIDKVIAPGYTPPAAPAPAPAQ